MNFSWDVRRNTSTSATDLMALASGHYWDVPGSLLPVQPVLSLPFHGNGNPPSPGSPGYSPPALSTPNSIGTTLSLNISGYPSAARLENPSTSRATDPRTATGNNFQCRASSFSANPSSSNEFPKLSMALVGELDEGDPEGGTMDDEDFNLNDDNIDEDAVGVEEYVVHPMFGGPIKLNDYQKPYQPVVFPPPNPNAERRARVISEVITCHLYKKYTYVLIYLWNSIYAIYCSQISHAYNIQNPACNCGLGHWVHHFSSLDSKETICDSEI